MGPGANASEPGWFEVVGGPPPAEVVFRDTVAGMAAPLGLLLLSLWVETVLRLFCMVLAVALAVVMSLVMRRRWWRRQGVRVVGTVLEHRNGPHVARVALTRATLTTSAAPPGTLVLVLDDGRTHLAVGRRAEPHELSELPPRLGPYVELLPDDFEAIRLAAQRTYPRA